MKKFNVTARSRSARHRVGAEEGVRNLLAYIGDEPDREGLKDTPRRVLDAWRDEWGIGYFLDPKSFLKEFADGAEGVDEMVVVRDIDLWSHCEHHLAPFFGVAHIAYVPNGKIVGLSKLARVVNAFARRLQVQERLTNQIADLLADALKPQGVGVIVEARHFCMCSRGVRTRDAMTITSALRGCIKDEPEARAEFMRLCAPRS